MIGAGDPDRLKPPHALVADEGVLQGVVQGVAHVQAPRDVGGRHEDDEGGLAAFGVGHEGVFRPLLGPLGFHGLGIVGLGQVHATHHFTREC